METQGRPKSATMLFSRRNTRMFHKNPYWRVFCHFHHASLTVRPAFVLSQIKKAANRPPGVVTMKETYLAGNPSQRR
jgi:hypothetical protein